MLRKELIQVFRNTITLRMVLMVPVIQLIIFGYVAILDVDNIPTAVLDHSKSPQSRRLLSDFFNSGYFLLERTLESESQIDALLDGGVVDIVIVIPEDFARCVANGEPTELLGVLDGSDSNNAITAGNYFASITSRYAIDVTTKLADPSLGEIKIPFEARTRVFYNPKMETIYYLVPGIIAILVIMLLVMLSAISIVREREQGTLEQLTVTPIRAGELVLGKTIPFVLIGYVLILLITIVGVFWFGVPIKGEFHVLLVLGGLYMFASLGLGMLVSSMSNTQQQAMMMSMFVLIPQIILSGFIFPIESMPEILQWVTYLLPARYFLIMIRGVFLKGIGFSELLPETLSLAALTLVILVISIFRFNRRMEI